MPGMKYKIFDSEVKDFDEKDLTVEHFISTERVDRGKEVMRADGMRIIGKPVVLLQHGRGAMGAEPIAKPLWIKKGEFKKKKGIIAKTKYFDDEQGIGRRLWQKAKEGFMPNWSVGYDILNYQQKRDFLDIIEWDLLEYSQVGVPMNPDAQTIYTKSYEDLETVYKDIEEGMDEKEKEKAQDILPFRFILMPEEEGDGKDAGEKPYENEHACHIVNKDWDKVRRKNNKFGDGIHALFGIKSNIAELASLRFDSSKFTASEAKSWCKEHDHKCNPFEPAKQKKSEYSDEYFMPDDLEMGLKKLISAELTSLKNDLSVHIEKTIDEKLKDKGPASAPPGDPASGGEGGGESHDINPRPMKLVIKQDEEELQRKQREENARALAEMIASAVGSGFKKGIRRLLGKVD